MIDPPRWQTRMSPRIFLKSQHAHGQKMIDPPSMTDQDLHLEFFLKIQHLYGQKMIDPPVWKTRISPGIFLKIQVHMVNKMIDPPIMTDQDLTLNFL